MEHRQRLQLARLRNTPWTFPEDCLEASIYLFSVTVHPHSMRMASGDPGSVASQVWASLRAPSTLEAKLRLRISSAIVLFFLCSIRWAQAGATLFLGEPYSYDGVFAGTGHAAVYLAGICTISPVAVRLCSPGETGIVLSRYRGIGGYDWIAIPLIPYLYAVEKQEDIPIFADKKLVSFLRDRYRREHLEAIVPDLPDDGVPGGAWYQLIGASYLRTIYAFEIETSPEQDAKLIQILNDRSNEQRWNLVTANCADFARQVISFYHPHSVHRGIIGDLGVTTPKQLARTLSKYSTKHPELQMSRFVIPQVPGTIPRSKRVRGVLEVMLTSKKYMLPLFLFHPYASVAAVALCVGWWHFNPGKNAPVLDSNHQLGTALTRADRAAVREQLEELVWSDSRTSADPDERHWATLHAAAEPTLDVSGGPVLQLLAHGEVTSVGITRSNILSSPAGSEFAAGLVLARLRLELKSSNKKIASSDVESDLSLLQQLLASQPQRFARTSLSSPKTAWVLQQPAANAQKVTSYPASHDSRQ